MPDNAISCPTQHYLVPRHCEYASNLTLGATHLLSRVHALIHGGTVSWDQVSCKPNFGYTYYTRTQEAPKIHLKRCYDI